MVLAVDNLRQDDIRSARELSLKDKLDQALEAMAYGLEVKRENLQRGLPEGTVSDIDKAFEAWLFERD